MMLSSGSRVGPYLVQDKLGEGGNGEVYRPRDTTLNRDVAIKVLPPPVANDADKLARFQREAQLRASLNHPMTFVFNMFDELRRIAPGGQR